MSSHKDKLDKAIKEVYDDLSSMTEEEFRLKIDKYINHPVTNSIAYAMIGSEYIKELKE